MARTNTKPAAAEKPEAASKTPAPEASAPEAVEKRTVRGVRITAKREGFRRCGIAHSEKGQDFPLDRFNETEAEALMNDPMLICTPVEIEVEEAAENETA